MKADVPLVTSRAGAPLLYGALGLSFHLESLTPADGERLESACARVLDWVGPGLRWTASSVGSEVTRFSPADLELVSSVPTQLVDVESAAQDTARARRGAGLFAAAKLDRFGVACHGGAERNDASSSSFRFYLTAGPAGADGLLTTRAMLSITVPESSDPEVLCARATELASDLRLRWGAAGLTYGAWELDRYGETRDALFAHARRHPGYDMGQHATLMETWHHRLRTVSWLTFVGPSLAGPLAPGPAASDGLLAITKVGDGLLVRAGAAPARGDRNRADLSPAYVQADARLRSLRASTGVHFMAPWSEATSLAWLRRFEPER